VSRRGEAHCKPRQASRVGCALPNCSDLSPRPYPREAGGGIPPAYSTGVVFIGNWLASFRRFHSAITC
jgi:hypothetical protein